MATFMDGAQHYPVLSSAPLFQGRIISVVSEQVALPTAKVTREVVRHPGAVGIIAVNDRKEILLLSQYRHPVQQVLWEPPAGLLDIPGEDKLVAAQRELAEEADLIANSWEELITFYTSPGGSDEELTIFLASQLVVIPEADRHHRTEEEAEMEQRWLPLADAKTAVMAGNFKNPTAVVGILAAANKLLSNS